MDVGRRQDAVGNLGAVLGSSVVIEQSAGTQDPEGDGAAGSRWLDGSETLRDELGAFQGKTKH